jgi:uncharacterized membrane protein
MATLFAVLYPDQLTGEKASLRVEGLQEADYLTVIDSAYVTKSKDGDIRIHEGSHPVRSGAAKGLILGALTGVIFSVPVLGIAAGTLAGLAIGRREEHNADKDFSSFAESVTEALQPGGSAILLLAESDVPERVREEFVPLGGRVMSTDLSSERLAEIQAQLDQASPA